ncbi:hypothetical protein NL676_014562 [Syzygium grande]|nr:hypothetical protein NL676_014562 [Syzygium grande]
MVVEVLKEINPITISILKSLLIFASPTKTGGWSLASRLMLSSEKGVKKVLNEVERVDCTVSSIHLHSLYPSLEIEPTPRTVASAAAEEEEEQQLGPASLRVPSPAPPFLLGFLVPSSPQFPSPLPPSSELGGGAAELASSKTLISMASQL